MNLMSGRLRAVTCVLPVLLMFSAGCDIAMADFADQESAEWRKTYELQAGGRVEISNVNGKIEVVDRVRETPWRSTRRRPAEPGQRRCEAGTAKGPDRRQQPKAVSSRSRRRWTAAVGESSITRRRRSNTSSGFRQMRK